MGNKAIRMKKTKLLSCHGQYGQSLLGPFRLNMPSKQKRIAEELRLLERDRIAIFVNRASAFTLKSFILFYGALDGRRMTAREVGAVLGCKPKAARKCAERALRMLRTIDLTRSTF